MSAAADAEDKTEKHAVTPGPLAPARELYGFMLLDRGMAKEALAAFEATKAKEPNRFHGFAGAAQAAEKLGDKAKAKENYQKLIALAATADSDRPGARRRAQVHGEQLGRATSRTAGDAMRTTHRDCRGRRLRARRAGRRAGVAGGRPAGGRRRGGEAAPPGLDRSGLALPDGPVGQGQGVPVQAGRLRHRGEPLSSAPRSASAIAPPASPTTRSSIA